MNENDLKNAADKLNDELEIERVDFSSVDEAAPAREISAEAQSVTDAAESAADEAVSEAQNISEDVSEAGSSAFNKISGGPVISGDMVDSSRFFRTAGNGTEQEEAAQDEELTDQPEESSSKKEKGKKNVGKEILSWILTFVIAFLVAIIINAYFFRISKVSGGSMLQTFKDGQTVFISRAPYIFSEPEYGDVVVFDHDQVHRNIFVEIKESVQYNIITMSITKKNFSHKYWIKRVIGVPNDTIDIKLDGVYRNDVRLSENYVNPEEIPDYLRNLNSFTVTKGEQFIVYLNTTDGIVSVVVGNPGDVIKMQKDGIYKKDNNDNNIIFKQVYTLDSVSSYVRRWKVGEGQLFVMGDNRNHSSDSRVIGLITINSVLGKVLGQ